MNSNEYSSANCVLCCYICNAKSDIFSPEQFMQIGKTIGAVTKNILRIKAFNRN